MTEKKIAETKAAMEKQIAEINASYANSKKAIDDKIALDKATAETAVKMAGEDKRLAEYKVLHSIHMGVNKKNSTKLTRVHSHHPCIIRPLWIKRLQTRKLRWRNKSLN